jgi:hypothetical protein
LEPPLHKADDSAICERQISGTPENCIVLNSARSDNQRKVSHVESDEIDSDALTDLMNSLANARVVLDLALSRLPDSERELKERVETAIKEIDSSRLKVLNRLVDKDS